MVKRLYCLALVLLLISGASTISDSSEYDARRQQAYNNQNAILDQLSDSDDYNWDVGPSKIILRRSTLSMIEQLKYNTVVLCLKSQPPITPSEVVPGSRSRFDDFIATHINQTLYIHGQYVSNSSSAVNIFIRVVNFSTIFDAIHRF
jgi:hypothetical protein